MTACQGWFRLRCLLIPDRRSDVRDPLCHMSDTDKNARAKQKLTVNEADHLSLAVTTVYLRRLEGQEDRLLAPQSFTVSSLAARPLLAPKPPRLMRGEARPSLSRKRRRLPFL